MSRVARIVEVGCPHHVVQRGNNKQRVFFDDDDSRRYLYLLKKYLKGSMCRLNAYCLMPNHVHMVLVPLEREALSKFMLRLGLSYTQHINRKYDRTGRLWECRFYSSLIQREGHLWTVCRYVERNPVRAHIVESPEDYNWSSSASKYSLNKGRNFVDNIWRTSEEREAYMNFLKLPDNTEDVGRIRRSTIRGIPVGSEEFVKEIITKAGITIVAWSKGRPAKEKMDVSHLI